MISRSIRNLIALLFWLLVTAVCVYANLQTVIANYLGTKAALELQGYEQQPLSTDPLVGHLFGTFFSGATLAQFFALGVATVTSLSFFFLCHIADEVYDLNEIRVETQNIDEKGRARRRMYLWLATAMLLVICLCVAVNWDLELFRYRTIADAMTGGDPEINPLEYPAVSEFLGGHEHLGIAELIRVGPWGYLAVTLLSCIGLEFAFRQLSDRWSRLMQPVDDLFDQPLEFYGYDADGQPVYDPAVVVAYDTDGNPIDTAEDDAILDQPVLKPRTGDATRFAAGSVTNPNGNTTRTVAPTGSLFDLPQTPEARSNDTWPDEVEERVDHQRELRDVIGQPGQQVTPSAAQADPEQYRVDPMTGKIWDRKFWDELHHAATEE